MPIIFPWRAVNLLKVALLLSAAWLAAAARVVAEEPVPAFLIHLDGAGRLTVARSDPRQVHLEERALGLIVWAEGNGERWQVVSGRWELPPPSLADTLNASLGALGGSRGQGAEGAGALALLTTQLEQLRGESVLREGAVLTPYSNGILLDPKITVRRKTADRGAKLPTAEAVIRRGGKEVARLPLPEGKTSVRWAEVAQLSAEGLEPGTYTLQLTPGVERVTFSVESPERRARVMIRPDELARLLDSRADPLYVQVAAEHLLAHREGGQPRPYLADALDVLEQLPEESRTPYLTRLREHVLKRLEDPGTTPTIKAAPGDATHVPEIDRVRDLIAAGQWARAEQALAAIPADGGNGGARTRGLVALYRGVIYAEAGPGKEADALRAFRRAVHELRDGAAGDRFRAHNNYANFLLSRAQDRLHNHAFQMAAGVRRPFLTALTNWSEAEHHYRAALELAKGLGLDEKAAAEVNLARLYVLLADVIRTLDVPGPAGHRFAAGDKAAGETARRLAAQALLPSVSGPPDPLIRAVAEELQAHLAFREQEVSGCLAHAEPARKAYTEAGSLAGVESVERLRGLCQRRLAQSGADDAARRRARQKALGHLLIAHQLAEVLRERFPPDRFGLLRAGFFARRAYVNELIVELFIAEGHDAEALRYAEQAKARALQDLLAAEGSRTTAARPPRELTAILRSWPKDVTALEYFLGSERAWVFVVRHDGTVQASVLAGPDGHPLPPRELVQRVRRFLDGVGHQAPKMLQQLNSGRGLDHSWQDTLHEFYQVLLPAAARSALGQGRTVVVVPHHILHYFPFAALVTRPDTAKRGAAEMVQPHFLVEERFDLCYAPSLATWDLLRRTPNRPITQVACLGIPNLPGTPSLPGVEDDIKNLKAAFGDKVRSVQTGADAHEAAAQALLRQPGLLLFAMHGTNRPDRPLESHLHLYPHGAGDGRLTAANLYAQPIATDVIVMSACYSGLADRSPLPGDDLFGLQRAFLQSGARAVVSGLWDVYDGTGPELMRGLFEQVAAGSGAPAALAASQRAFLKKLRASKDVEFWLHPYFWAVYTVAGDDRAGSRP